jgi:hypothetical protein
MRPFHGQIAVVQLNAIRSWLAARPACEVILIDDEEGTTPDAVQQLGVMVIKDVKRSRLGAPLLDDLLRIGAEAANHDILAFITADILLPPTFPTVATTCHRLMRGEPYLAAGARVDMLREIDLRFDDPDWFETVTVAAREHGKPRGHTALDLWVYPRSFRLNPPPFPIGRRLTDGWAVHHCRSSHIPVIDFTSEVLLVHQLHDRPAKRAPLFNVELLECVRLFENSAENAMSLIDADWVLRDGHLERPKGLRRVHSAISLFRPYRYLIGLRRKHRLPQVYRA